MYWFLAWTGENSGFQINLAHTARTQSGWALALLLVLYSAFKHPLSFWLKISCPNETNPFPTNMATYETFSLADCWRTQHAIISLENQIDPLKVSPVDKGHHEGWMPKSSRQGQPNAVSRSNVLGDPFLFFGSCM